jgi:serine/threonine-protein kinase
MGMLGQELKKVSMITHQNIAQVHKMVALEDFYFIVMEHVDGARLSTLIKQLKDNNRVCPPQYATLLIYALCSAMGYANRKKDAEGTTLEVVHGEITPDNILLSKDSDIKLVGLGLCKISAYLQYQQSNDLKNKDYTAPEVIVSGTPTKAGDIFSLGVVGYEMLTGRKPFSPEQIAAKNYVAPILPSRFNEKCTDIVDSVILRALSEDPARRFTEFQDMGLQLEETLYDKGFSWTQASFQKFLENNKIF